MPWSDADMAVIPARNRREGLEAETSFRCWLLKSKLGFLEVDQKFHSLPQYLRKIVKRPDFLVGILSVGMVAVDVKSRVSMMKDFIIIEHEEYESFSAFERYFGLKVWYACYVDKDFSRCLLFRNADIDPSRFSARIRNRLVLAIPINLMTPANANETFDHTLLRASRERLA